MPRFVWGILAVIICVGVVAALVLMSRDDPAFRTIARAVVGSQERVDRQGASGRFSSKGVIAGGKLAQDSIRPPSGSFIGNPRGSQVDEDRRLLRVVEDNDVNRPRACDFVREIDPTDRSNCVAINLSIPTSLLDSDASFAFADDRTSAFGFSDMQVALAASRLAASREKLRHDAHVLYEAIVGDAPDSDATDEFLGSLMERDTPERRAAIDQIARWCARVSNEKPQGSWSDLFFRLMEVRDEYDETIEDSFGQEAADRFRDNGLEKETSLIAITCM